MADFGDGFDFEGEATTVDGGVGAVVTLPPYPALAQFGPFEILGRIARGGMAEVYLAREPQPMGVPRHVVLKRVLPEREEDEDFIQMFRTEANLAIRLYHPNICHVYECGEIEGTTFMTLEFVYGITLRKLLRRAARHGGLSARVAAHIIAKVAVALDYVHQAKGVDGRALNIIHRDVSPHNVMIAWDGRIKLLDFGIAKTSKDDDEEEGVLKGKHAYLSPEQARGRPLDHRCDLFALGICLYESLTCRPLYHRESMLATLEAIVRDPVPSARDQDSRIAPEIEAVVRRSLQKKPSDRFQTGREMADAIDDYLWRSGGVVGPTDVVKVLDELFTEQERSPLPANSAQLTGSFHSLTGSLPAISSGSFGPFGSEPKRPVDEVAPPVEEEIKVDTDPPPPQPRPRANDLMGRLNERVTQFQIPVWFIGLLIGVAALVIGGLIAVATR